MDEVLGDLARLAAALVSSPIALITFADADRQWLSACVGVDETATRLRDALCEWTIHSTEAVVVSDARTDPRFESDPFVVGEPHIRFYAGLPVRDRHGAIVGTICVIDRESRPGLTAAQEAGLEIIARQAAQQLELRRVGREMLHSRRAVHAAVEHGTHLVLIVTADGTVTFASEVARTMLGLDPVERIGTNALDLVHPDNLRAAAGALREAGEVSGLHAPLTMRVAHADGSWRDVEVTADSRLADPDVAGIVLHLRELPTPGHLEERVEPGARQLLNAPRVAWMGTWEKCLHTGKTVWSPGLFHLCGLDPRTTEPSIDAWLSTMHLDKRESMLALVQQALQDGQPFSVRRRVLRPDGTEIVALCHVEVDRDDHGGATRLRGTVLDVTKQIELERSLGTERRFLRAVLDNLDEGVVACDAGGMLSVFNPATERLHGGSLTPVSWDAAPTAYGLYEADGVTPLRPDDVPLRRALTDGRVTNQEMIIAPPHTAPRLVRCSGQAIVDRDGTKLGAVVAMHDITAQRRIENQLRRLAEQDSLTGLANRSVLDLRVESELERGTPVAVLFIDIDSFKRINDDHGHHVGDLVLSTTGDRIRRSVKDSDTVARLGGDEFVVLCIDVRTELDAQRIADRVSAVLAKPMKIGDLMLDAPASVGWALSAPSTRAAHVLLARADQAMYRQKKNKIRHTP